MSQINRAKFSQARTRGLYFCPLHPAMKNAKLTASSKQTCSKR
nr:MAG TPA_asm: hypothetical protein [Caudoviricetes sp.]DAM00397.1 MAG TPA: hypothetical protein [Caudoviricetes sp.]